AQGGLLLQHGQRALSPGALARGARRLQARARPSPGRSTREVEPGAGAAPTAEGAAEAARKIAVAGAAETSAAAAIGGATEAGAPAERAPGRGEEGAEGRARAAARNRPTGRRVDARRARADRAAPAKRSGAPARAGSPPGQGLVRRMKTRVEYVAVFL